MFNHCNSGRAEDEYYEDNEFDYKQDSGRDSWWRGNVKDTPNPGYYECVDMVQELDRVKVRKTYGFKSSGRTRSANLSRSGEYLMPGLYKTKDFLEENMEKRMTYNFKSTDRNNYHSVVVGIQDKHLRRSNLSPVKYAGELPIVTHSPSTHAVFKSQSRRFPTIYFTPKEGPSPSAYNVKKDSRRGITSAFASKTPRFKKPSGLVNTPGPGAYTKLNQYPMPEHIRKLGRDRGLFFPPQVK